MKSLKGANAPVVSKAMVLTNVKVQLNNFTHTNFIYIAYCFMCCLCAHVLLTIDVDECKEKTACQCRNCQCQNTWGSYECTCGGSLLYMREHDTCISESSLLSLFSFFLFPYNLFT